MQAALQPVVALSHWMGASLARRFVSMSLGLLLVVQLTSYLVVDASMKRHARTVLPEQLAMASRTTSSLLSWRSKSLVEGARVLAADYGFRAAVQSQDKETIASVLSNHGARIGASEAALLSTDLRLVASAEATVPEAIPPAQTLVRFAGRAGSSGGATGFAVVGGQPRQMVMVPLKAPMLVGWVLMYFPLTDEIAEQVSKLSGADLTLLSRASPKAPWALAFSHLDAADSAALLKSEGPAVDASEAMADIPVGEQRLGIRTLSLTGGENIAGRDAGQVLAVLSVSVDAALKPPADLQVALLAATFLGFTTFGLASALTARRVTTPLQSLATAVRRLGAGDASTKVQSLGNRDEVGELARAFEAMRASLATKQEQIVQSEKLASIGQLAAGVAHEINNPIGFVFSNFGTLENYLAALFRMLGAYRTEEAALAGTPAALRLARLRDEIELDYLVEDIPSLMSESKDGIKRVRKIVQDLKDFSHADANQQWDTVDLHTGLDSTLNIVNNEIKYKADVVKAYGALPEVECLPHELNQVFMNLLINASHAIGPERGTITVRTGTDAGGAEAWVQVEDTGSGIAPADLKRIFDPFFTTKPVGKGTGLGLSLAYGIVKTHGGRIEVTSQLGEGTRFRVCIPTTRAVTTEPIEELATA